MPLPTNMNANLLSDLPAAAEHEHFEPLLRQPGLIIERIVSHGQSSPAGFWYDQPQGEWVTVLSGWTELQLEGEAEPRRLNAGDWMNLPPHQRHRVEATAPNEATVWLAVHYGQVS